jgi:hypothetical protein
MDNTERPYKITIGGVEYDAAPLPEEHVVIMATLRAKGDDLMRSVKTLCRIVETALGRAAWDSLSDRWMSGEVTFADIGEAVPTLLKMTVSDVSNSKQSV